MRAADLNILAFDTVTEACSVALLLRGAVEQRLELGARHSRRVLGMAEEVMRAAGAELRDLDALAVDVGPGAFTGARLGIGVAQGLAYGAGLPVSAVNSLQALAEDVLRPGDGDAAGDGDDGDDGIDGDGDDGVAGDADNDGALVLPAIDARMGQVYFGLYGGDLRAIIEPALAAPGNVGDALAPATVDSVIGAGSGWDRYAPALQESLEKAAVASSRESSSVTVEWLPGRHPQAAAVARIASARGLSNTVGPLHLRAVYIRNQVARPSSR